MKSVLIYLLAAWYTDIRKGVPAATSRRLNAGIKSFADSDPAVAACVEEAKKIADAERVRNRRKTIGAAIRQGRMKNGNIVHVPCGRKR